ncbi:hypothetical protein [Clostridium algidicarnis]|uniref:hypothetical protein n=1 Tax=Clostridium algidicarnis TaxID=37659 RepID=UPI001629CCE9|nr:hypothetical protein [Clostridium algidicarnis]MBB6629984.1 hypothetical protein [Clostridium algidicarnis]
MGLVVPSIDSNPEIINLVLRLLESKEPINQGDLADELMKDALLGNVTNKNSAMRKTEMARYFGLVTLVGRPANLYITERGRRYRLANEKSKIDIIFESLINDSFGRNNNGINGTDSDVEAPNIFLRSIIDLSGVTTLEYASILFLMDKNNLVYNEAIEEIQRRRSENSIEEIINIIKNGNFDRKYGTNNKIINFFKYINIVYKNEDKYHLSEEVFNIYKDVIKNLNIVNNINYSEIEDEETNSDDYISYEHEEEEVEIDDGTLGQLRFFLSRDFEQEENQEQDYEIDNNDNDNDGDRTLVDWSAAEEKIKLRKERHEEVLDRFKLLLRSKGFDTWKGNIDCLGVKSSKPTIIGEVKTLNGTMKDERAQVTKAFAQLYYYEMFAMSKFSQYSSQKVAIFESRISEGHRYFLEKNNIKVIWQDENGEFNGIEDTIGFFNEL